MVTKESLWFKFMSRVSSSTKYYIVLGLILTGYTYLLHQFYGRKLDDVREIEIEIAGNQFERPLREIIRFLPEHRSLMRRSIRGEKGIKDRLLSRRNEISENFLKLLDLDQELGDQLRSENFPISLQKANHLEPHKLLQSWDNLKGSAHNIDIATSEESHKELLENVKQLINLIGDSTGLALDEDFYNYYLMSTTMVTIPAIHSYLNNILQLIDEAVVEKKLTDESRYELISSLALLENSLNQALSGIGRIYQANHPKNEENITPALFRDFSEKLQEFIQRVNRDVIYSEDISLINEELQTLGQNVNEVTSTFWDAAIDQTDKELHVKRIHTLWGLWIPVTISLLIALFGFGLGLYFVLTVVGQLEEIENQTKRFASGDLSARAKVGYQDEAGRLALAFNGMAAHLEGMIGELNKLLVAIKQLAAGDFSVRVEVENSDSEMGDVAHSFNQMAASFSDIIGQIGALATNLSSSAAEISDVSKQQEESITEQEATTREISVTANEISTTSRDFATTMNEVSSVADGTAQLASKGKQSLTEMSEAMRQMVKASGDIATKLAILNDKANNITSIITTITKVADQTNLLSFNAAIEAEKAGEYGKSFAVIAKEIRRLADLTAFATLDIEKIINEIMRALSQSVEGVDDFTQEISKGGEQVGSISAHFNTIIEQVQALSNRFDIVNQGMQSQALGAEQINSAIAQLNQVAKETTTSLSHFRATLHQLDSGAKDLRQAIERIKKENIR